MRSLIASRLAVLTSSATVALAVALGAAVVASPAAAQHAVAPGEADCSTPRRALETWLTNLQEDDLHPSEATRCFDWGAVRIVAPARRVAVAERFKRVLDARGLYVAMDDVPDVRDPGDEPRVTPFPNGMPGFYLVKKGDQWVIAAETIRHVPGWYDETFAFDVDSYLDAGPAFLRDRVLGIAWWQVLLLLSLIVVSLVIRQVISWSVQTQGTQLLTKLVRHLDGALLERAAKPIGTVAMTLLLMWAFPILRFGVDVNRVANFALRVASAVAGVIIVYRLVDVFSDVMAKRAEESATKLDDQLVPLIRKSLKTVTVVLGIIFVLQNMEVDVASLIAGVSLGGLAFTLAARDTVANLFGSLSIFADQPFQVGDWVVMQGVEGVVEEVGMRSTRVRTFYQSVVSIPNSKVADGIIDNYGMRKSRRTNVKLGLQYDTTPEQIEAFCDGVRAILASNPIVKKDAYHVNFVGFADSALEVMLYFFFVTDSWAEELTQRQRIYLQVLRLAKQLGIEFAFPTRTLHVATQAQATNLSPNKPPRTQELAVAVHAFGPGGSLSGPSAKITHGYFPGGDHDGQGNDPDADRSDSRDDDG